MREARLRRISQKNHFSDTSRRPSCAGFVLQQFSLYDVLTQRNLKTIIFQEMIMRIGRPVRGYRGTIQYLYGVPIHSLVLKRFSILSAWRTIETCKGSPHRCHTLLVLVLPLEMQRIAISTLTDISFWLHRMTYGVITYSFNPQGSKITKRW